MRLFNSESVYVAQLGKWEERFWIDGKLVDGDLYFFELDREKEIENKKLQNHQFENNPCDVCPCKDCCEDDDEFDYEDLLDVFVDRILNTEGCPGCIADILDEFADIFIPDEDEFEEYECDCEECCDELVDCIEPSPDIVINIGELYIDKDFDIDEIVKALKNLSKYTFGN